MTAGEPVQPKPSAGSRLPRPSLSMALVVAGLAWAALALLDPLRPSGAVMGPLLAGAGLLLAARRRQPWTRLVPLVLLTAAFGAAAGVGPEFRADSVSYYVYLRSLAFDADLDFANEWARWGYPELPLTETGLRRNVHSVGPAVLWSPFFALAHLYLKAEDVLGAGRYPADGYSVPYRRSTALGTLAAVWIGAWLLFRMMARATVAAVAALAVAGAVLTSPVLYYAFVTPAMAHGAAFGAAAALLWAWDRARRAPSLGAWTLVGVLLGLACLMRWQAAVYGLLVLGLAVEGLLRSRVRPIWLGAAAAGAALAFLPQMLVWKALYGRFLTLPHGGGFVDWSSPNLLNALVSADHGLFSWTPAMVLGLAGLIAGLRASLLLHGGALVVFAASAWVNGGVYDWAGGDAFGARRFDVAVPLMAVGLGSLILRMIPIVARAPLLVPAALLLALALWNVGFVALFRQGRYPGAAPLERLAADQVRQLRRAAETLLGWIAGPRGRALAYKYFVAEYLYTGFNPGGTIDLPEADERELLGGWSSRHRRPEGLAYRWALYPEACVRVPLEDPIDLPVVVTVRAPRGAQPQVMTLIMNGSVVGTAPVGTEWSDLPFAIPRRHVVPGENHLCLRFLSAAPGEEGGRAAAAVARIQLP